MEKQFCWCVKQKEYIPSISLHYWADRTTFTEDPVAEGEPNSNKQMKAVPNQTMILENSTGLTNRTSFGISSWIFKAGLSGIAISEIGKHSE